MGKKIGGMLLQFCVNHTEFVRSLLPVLVSARVDTYCKLLVEIMSSGNLQCKVLITI